MPLATLKESEVKQMIRIGKTHGLQLWYNSNIHRFILWNDEQEEMGRTETQEQAEVLAKKLSKEKFEPILAFERSDLDLYPCTITSLNREDKSFWYTMDKNKRRGKERLRCSNFYVQTEANKKVAGELAKIVAQIKALEEKGDKLMKKLESRIDFNFFGISDE